jgi:hypothetical protein
MERSGKRWGAGRTIGVIVGLLLACNGIREDEFACENAVAHLQQCCPGFTGSNIACIYEPPPVSCGGSDPVSQGESPDLDLEQSACIRAATCDQLRSSGACDRAAATSSNLDVCP